jgi:hypothetical protein
MSPYVPPWQRLCDCTCPVHFRSTRTTYDHAGCACTITCATQPITLLAERWSCALFLDYRGALWHVPVVFHGTWVWQNAGQIDDRSEFYEASVTIEHLLRACAHVLAGPTF